MLIVVGITDSTRNPSLQEEGEVNEEYIKRMCVGHDVAVVMDT
jgi:hypothetical protein